MTSSRLLLCYVKWVLASGLLLAGQRQQANQAEHWLGAIHHAMAELHTRPSTPAPVRQELQALLPGWTRQDTASPTFKRQLAREKGSLDYRGSATLYKDRLEMRQAFLQTVRQQLPQVFAQEVMVVEFPVSGEQRVIQFFLLYRVRHQVWVRRYTYWGSQWSVAGTSRGHRLHFAQFYGADHCYNHGLNSEPLSVIRFQDQGNTVSATYYPVASYCGKVDLFFSL
jgi:hypothetical protein